jgi:phosphoserine phosphatase RsbU/P
MHVAATLWKRLGLAEHIFGILLLLWATLGVLAPGSFLGAVVQALAFVAGIVVAIRMLRVGIRGAIWRLRNRLLVAYGFIALVPVVLIVLLGYFGLSTLAARIAITGVRDELNHQFDALHGVAAAVAGADPRRREEITTRAGAYFNEKFPGFQMIATSSADGTVVTFPVDAPVQHPPRGWGDVLGLVVKDGRLFAWDHLTRPDTEVTVLAPLEASFFESLAPKLGGTRLTTLSESTQQTRAALRRQLRTQARQEGASGTRPARGIRGWLDTILEGTPLPVAIWDAPGSTETVNLGVRTSISAVVGLFFGPEATVGGAAAEGSLLILYFSGILFLIVELVSMAIGISLTRTITGAVHELYEGTERVMHGDFSHRIAVPGHDQLAELGASFNRMTENVERLLIVAKEKERLQAEIEIAREVQNQLFPKVVPETKTLRLRAHCTPARMVSGDYYDYQTLLDNLVAIAMGDVAGKGISAALLMATLQSSLRTQLRNCLERAAQAQSDGEGSGMHLSTAALVSQLNQQLYSFTSPEKYSTFILGVYDDGSGRFTYTNAGHLPPILLRDGEARRLDINGMVVGAFEFASYEESSIVLDPGDLLVFYTDGITEPENEYGEMFGEDRLIEAVQKAIDSDEDEIIANVIQSVRQWTGSPELQDDMTILLARRV